jgi:TetR/AcrR family transcriptional regulator, cholesterol catabolism regulator
LPIWRKEARADHIYGVAAEIMSDRGYEATSMNDIADAVGLTKPGLYHYIRGKEDLLFQIMNYAMDVVDKNVVGPAREVTDAEERLRTILERHSKTLLEGVSAVTTLLEETWALTPTHRRIIRGRQRAYFDLLRRTLEQLATEGKLRDVSPVVAVFSLFGMMLWIARWYRRDGKLKPEEALQDILRIAMNSVLKERNESPQ